MAKKHTKKFSFIPFSKKQLKALTWWTDESPYKECDTIIADGSIRAGKTIACIDSFITWSLGNHKYRNFIIAGKSMGALKRNVLMPLFEILNAKGIDYHYDKQEDPKIIIGTNYYYLFGASNEKSQDTLQGLTAGGALADEIALFPESFVNQMIGRCSEEGSKIFLNCNPESPHHWFKRDYIDKAEDKNIFYLHFTMDDNPTISEEVKKRYERMFSGVWYQRYILGMWSVAEGIIYDMFNEDKHTFQEYSKRYDEYYVSIDYGTSSVMCFLLYGIKKNNVYVLDEYYYDAKEQQVQKTDDEFVKEFSNFLNGIDPRLIYVDPSASSFKVALKRYGYNQTRDADNNVINGIRTVGSFFNTNRLFIHTKCKNLIREFYEYRWDEKNRDKGIDKPLKENDHAVDTLRYFIYTKFGNERSVNVKDRYKKLI
jgi:PBSX family phage terminase large subunit